MTIKRSKFMRAKQAITNIQFKIPPSTIGEYGDEITAQIVTSVDDGSCGEYKKIRLLLTQYSRNFIHMNQKQGAALAKELGRLFLTGDKNAKDTA